MTSSILNHQYIGRALKEGDVGLELEVEAEDDLPEEINEHWTSKTEGSLRGFAMEYTTAGPIKCDGDKFNKIKSLTDILNRADLFVLRNSPRTSLHVHVNVGGLTPLQTWTAASAGWLFENLLMEYCGESRKGNLFCLRTKDAEGTIRLCSRDLLGKIPYATLKTDIIRYASQNMNAIPKFGSIEYRGMRGTIDPELIHEWSDQLHRMMQSASQQFKDPSELLDRYYNKESHHSFLSRFFSSGFVSKLIQIPGWQDMIDDSVERLLEFAYYHSDWKKYQDRLEDHFSKNPVKIVDPSRIPLGVPLSTEDYMLAIENGYPMLRRRNTWTIPFYWNEAGFKAVNFDPDTEYLYSIGSENICPHVPWETREHAALNEPVPILDQLMPADHTDSVFRAYYDTSLLSSTGSYLRVGTPITVTNTGLSNITTFADELLIPTEDYDE